MISTILWSIILPLQVLSYGSYTILVHLSESSKGKITYSSVSLNFIIELSKLTLSCFLFFIKKLYDYISNNANRRVESCDSESLQVITNNADSFDMRYSLYYAIPGFLYFINNNLAIYMQFYMDSATYQMLCNLKILSTSVLYYLIMKKSLTKRKWLSLILLFFAGIFYCFGNLGGDLMENVDGVRNRVYITKLGIFLITVYTTISGLAGVYTEYILKINYSASIYIQNMYLYTWGCIFNLFSFFLQKFYFPYLNEAATDETVTSLFYGYNIFTWLIIITQVFNGFSMSIVMKHSNNLTRLFIISMSLIVTVTLSVILFSLKLNFYFYISFASTLIALYLYTK